MEVADLGALELLEGGLHRDAVGLHRVKVDQNENPWDLPAELKREFGKAICFWGGGCDTQRILLESAFFAPGRCRICTGPGFDQSTLPGSITRDPFTTSRPFLSR